MKQANQFALEHRRKRLMRPDAGGDDAKSSDALPPQSNN